MDRIKKKKKWSSKRIILILVSLFGVIGLISLATNTSTSAYRIDSKKVQFGKVVYDDFQDIIPVSSNVEPKQSVQLDAIQGGVVEEIFVEDGTLVNKGQPLMRLSNTTLTLDFMNRETQIVEQINSLRNIRINLEQTKRQLDDQLLNIDYQLGEQKRKYNLEAPLYNDSLISEDQFLKTKAQLDFLKKRAHLLEQQLKTDEQSRSQQLSQIDESIVMMQRNLKAIKSNLNNLTIKATTSGQLNSFDHEIGQTKSRGENIGRIDQIDNFILKAQVDQYYLNRIKLHQKGKFEHDNRTYQVTIKKVLPTVVNNQFEIQLAFTNEAPNEIRRGQNFQVFLELSAKTKSLMIPRGAFYQSSGGRYVFVVEPEGNAQKRMIKLGNQNPDYIQVLDGLHEGEQIITSSYNSFTNVEQIILESK